MDEAACRSAVSRAYYGAFNLAREFLVTHGLDAISGHAGVWRAFQAFDGENRRLVGRELEALYSFRRAADYELSSRKIDFNAEVARRCVEKAIEIERLLALG